MYPTFHQARRAVLPVLLVVAAAGLTACGSSSSASSASSSSSAAAGGPSSTAAFTKFSACLKSHGVTLPQRRGGAPAGGRAPGGGGAPAGGRGGGLFFGGAGGRGAAGSTKDRAAFSACRKDLPSGGKFGGGRSRGGPGGRPTGGGHFAPAALTKFSACVKQHGYTLPKPDTSGKGPVFPRSIESNATFQKAARACSADLKPAGGTTASG
jgi:hypothetical protein